MPPISPDLGITKAQISAAGTLASWKRRERHGRDARRRGRRPRAAGRRSAPTKTAPGAPAREGRGAALDQRRAPAMSGQTFSIAGRSAAEPPGEGRADQRAQRPRRSRSAGSARLPVAISPPTRDQDRGRGDERSRRRRRVSPKREQEGEVRRPAPRCALDEVDDVRRSSASMRSPAIPCRDGVAASAPATRNARPFGHHGAPSARRGCPSPRRGPRRPRSPSGRRRRWRSRRRPRPRAGWCGPGR